MAEVFNNDAFTILAASIGVSDTTLTVQSNSQFTTSGTFRIRIDDELMTVTGASGTTWTVTRASEVCEGVQTAAAHAAGAGVYGVLTAGALATIAAASGGTVTSVAVATANGVSGSVATPSTTPTITITLGAITPSSVTASGTVTGSNLTGTNTGDQIVTLTSDVTGSGTGTFATTISGHAVTYAKIQQASTATLLGNPTGSTANVQEVTLGTGLSFVGSTLVGNIGTVTSVAMTVPTGLSVSGSPITGSGTFAVTWSTESANLVFAGPTSGGASAPTFRSLVANDIPTLSYVTSVNVSGGTTGLTTSGGPITGSGTITIAGILIAANGGLGIDTSVFTNGQIPLAQGSGVYAADNRRGLYTGTGPPSAGLGFPGDYYIDLSTTPNAIWQKS